MIIWLKFGIGKQCQNQKKIYVKFYNKMELYNEKINSQDAKIYKYNKSNGYVNERKIFSIVLLIIYELLN